MDKRLFAVLPDLASALQFVQALEAQGLNRTKIYSVANEATSLAGLPPASILQTSDFIYAAKLGLGLGGTLGVLAGYYFSLDPDLAFAGLGRTGMVVSGGLIGALMSMILTSMPGAGFTNKKLVPYQEVVSKGHILILADIPKTDEEKYLPLFAPLALDRVTTDGSPENVHASISTS